LGGALGGRVAIVTGAGHGIGRGHALELAKQGARVIVNDLGGSLHGEGTSKDADLTVALIESRGGEAIANYGDVADFDQAHALVQQAIDAWGTLDVVVNNAGIVRDAAIWNMTEADFDAVMRVHVKGTWAVSRHAAVHWRAEAKAGRHVAGRIINTTSGAGLTGNFGQTNYATAKAAIVGLTQTLALELHSSGVTANAVGPAGLTRITATIPGSPPAFEADEVPPDEWHPMDPSNSSPLVAWLASEESAYVTGQVFRVIDDRIHWMQGWREAKSVASGGKKWDFDDMGRVLTVDLFGTRGAALRF
jgi:NAD(P)-dependent dehydrogenase (short-subunit alcohol dehydrogenase family)